MTGELKGLGGNLTDYGDADFSAYLRRSFARSMGYSSEMLRRPVIGIATAASGFNNCHRTTPEILDALKRGVVAAGGLPLEFPTVSLGEVFLHPTSMMFRNLMAMDIEEMIRAQPMDAVVLVGGCDKTVPAQIMGALSAARPFIQLVVGPMMTGRYRGERLGAVTAGTCAVMGTASTMACIAETLGVSLPGTAAIPAVHADRLRAAEATGRRAVEMAAEGLTPETIVTPEAIENAFRVLLALGGSTNAVVHLTAIAGRVGIEFALPRLNALGETTPVLVDLKPTGVNYMEDFYAAGGVGAVLRELASRLHLDARNVAGETLRERLSADAPYVDRDVIRSVDAPFRDEGGLIALFGNLAPDGAILKRAAADAALMESEGRAVVFDSLADLAERIDDPALDVNVGDVLVLRNAGPKAAGMPEAGYLPIPAKLARQGVKDMVRISDARMSGTAFGTIVLHVAPEAAAGGPLALVETGDRIRLSAASNSLELLVDDATLEKRRANLGPPTAMRASRGYKRLYLDHVLQADKGCDFDFLRADGGR